MTTKPKEESLYAKRGIESVPILRGESKDAIGGRAATFYNSSVEGSEYLLWDLGDGERAVERMHPGAFDKVLERGDDVIACFNHNHSLILGRSSAGTLTMSSNDEGLDYQTTPGDTQAYRDTREMIRRGEVRGSSFLAYLSEDDFTWDMEGDLYVRNVRSVSVFLDVAAVVKPCYKATSAEMRSKSGSSVLEAWRSLEAVRSASRRAVEVEHELREKELYLIQNGLTTL